MQQCLGSGLPYYVTLEFMPGPSPFDEMTNADGSVREPYLILEQWLKEQKPQALNLMASDAISPRASGFCSLSH